MCNGILSNLTQSEQLKQRWLLNSNVEISEGHSKHFTISNAKGNKSISGESILLCIAHTDVVSYPISRENLRWSVLPVIV